MKIVFFLIALLPAFAQAQRYDNRKCYRTWSDGYRYEVPCPRPGPSQPWPQSPDAGRDDGYYLCHGSERPNVACWYSRSGASARRSYKNTCCAYGSILSNICRKTLYVCRSGSCANISSCSN